MTVLRNIEISEVSLVKKGAGKGVRVTLYKGMQKMSLEDILAKLSPEERAVVEAAMAPPVPAEKAMPPPEDEKVVKARAESDVLRAEITKLRGEASHREYLEKAAAYSKVPGMSRDEMARALQSVDTLPKDVGACIRKSWDMVAGVVEKAFAPVGSSASDVSTPASKIEAIAKALRTASPSMSEQAAIVKAYAQNPELYAEVRKGG